MLVGRVGCNQRLDQGPGLQSTVMFANFGHLVLSLEVENFSKGKFRAWVVLRDARRRGSFIGVSNARIATLMALHILPRFLSWSFWFCSDCELLLDILRSKDLYDHGRRSICRDSLPIGDPYRRAHEGRASELVLLGYRTSLDGRSSWWMEFDFRGSDDSAVGPAFSAPAVFLLIRFAIGLECFVDVAAHARIGRLGSPECRTVMYFEGSTFPLMDQAVFDFFLERWLDTQRAPFQPGLVG
ncbi:hypothetical protein F2Q69_00008430 [Brassica cretica]|uniref:Uncharacterized protein n=1 Tax=Brassica cretica TaxID=69181 RepID=A0A8S9PGL8_BRACR|nr:hypothetical protein F2Q69_00008430 [Brassica cretica]